VTTMEQGEKGSAAGRVVVKIPWWKRKYLVNRELQFRFARSAFVMGAVTTVVSVGLIMWTLWHFNIWQGQRLPLGMRVGIGLAMLFNLLSMFIVTVMAMHRVTGPVFNLLRQFHVLSRGDFSATACFRATDEMHYVARRFNEMVMMLRVRNDFINRKVDEAIVAIEQGRAEEAKHALDSIREMRSLEKKTCHESN
jgi:hypothetical protein